MKSVFLSTPLSEYNLVVDFDNLLFSVIDAYESTVRYNRFRKRLNGSRICYDSGGFQLLMGTKSQLDPMRTLRVYENLGYEDHDLLLQLDVPPNPRTSRDEREQRIIQSARFFHVMYEKNDRIIPVVHGWTEDELKLSLTSLHHEENPISLGSYLATVTRALHNACVVLHEVEMISLEFENDPDGYWQYLEKRWNNSPYWRTRMKLVREQLRQEYVQSRLDVFLRM